jgi:hypothetical protein
MIQVVQQKDEDRMLVISKRGVGKEAVGLGGVKLACAAYCLS